MAGDLGDPFGRLRVRHASDGRACEDIEPLEKADHVVEDDRPAEIGIGDIIHRQPAPGFHVFGKRLFEMPAHLGRASACRGRHVDSPERVVSPFEIGKFGARLLYRRALLLHAGQHIPEMLDHLGVGLGHTVEIG